MKAQTYVPYYPNGTQFSRVVTRLSWTDNDHLVLERLDESGQPCETYFDSPIAEVAITGAMSTPKFTVGAQGYRVDFAESARIQASLMGVVAGALDSPAARGTSTALYAQGTAASGVEQWMAALQAAGARSRYWTTRKLMVVTVVGGLALVAVIAVGVVISALGAFTLGMR